MSKRIVDCGGVDNFVKIGYFPPCGLYQNRTGVLPMRRVCTTTVLTALNLITYFKNTSCVGFKI